MNHTPSESRQTADTSLVRTKLAMPSVDGVLLDRAIGQRAKELLSQKISVIHAPGGYGKTTTLVQWAAQLRASGALTAWLSLDEYDTDPSRILGYLAAALSHAGIALPSNLEAQIDRGLSNTEITHAALTNAAGADGRAIALFVDDHHHIDDSSPVATMLARFIKAAPSNLHFIISSRERPAALIGRNTPKARVLEFTMDDLRFNRTELKDFLKQAGVAAIDNSGLKTLHFASEGWVAGLKLAISGGEGDLERMKAILEHNRAGIEDFFAYDVFDRQPQRIQNFLLQTSVLDRFSIGLAEAVTDETNTKEIINSLRDAGLFIFSLNPESGWFRYHHLFSNFLRGVLQFRFPEYESRLHIQASDWFWNKGFIQEAFTHALKGNDESRAAKILDTHCAQILNEGRPAQLLKMSEHLTNNAIQDFPNLALTKAWALIVHWRFEQAQLFINIAEDAISRQRKQHEGADGYFSKLYWKLLHVKMLYARFRDQLDEVRSHCNQLLSEHNIDEPDVLGVAYDTLIHVETDQFDFSRINYLERKTLHLLEERDRTYIMIWHKATIGRARLLEGDSQAAIAACEQGIASAQALGAELSHFASIPGLVLAETHYLRNEIEDARTLCDRYWSNFSQIGFPEQVISAILVRSRILRIDNKVDEANALVMEGMRQGDAQRFGRLQRYMAYELIGDALSNGKLRTARDIFDKHVSSNSNTFSPGKNANGSSDRKALAWTRLALAEGEYAAARKTAMRWRDFTFQAGACLSMTRWNILLSVIALRDGDERAALRHLRDAVRAARPGRYIQPFLKEGQPIQELLTHLHAASATSSAAEREFTANVLNAFPGQGAPHANKDETPQPAQSIEGHVYGAIADRELEILNCLASGLSNREIGDILGMTEGTVKWHLQQIYNKLGVRRRQLALNKAMRLGLIN